MKKPTNEPHDFIVEKIEAHPDIDGNPAVLLTDVRGGRVRLQMPAEQARLLAALLSDALADE